MSNPTDPSDGNRTPEQPTEDRGSELGGAVGSASELLQKWNRLIEDRRKSLESMGVCGIEQEIRVIRTDTNILLSFMQGTLKMLAAHEASKPNAKVSESAP